MKKNNAIVLLLNLLLLVFIVQPIRAEVVSIYNPISANSVPELVNSMVRTILGIVGAVALLMFVYGGLLWMTSGGNEQRITRGRDTLIWASVGLAVIFGSYAILSVLFKAFEGS